MLRFLNCVKKTQQEMREEFENLQFANLEKHKHHASKFNENENFFNLQNERVRKKISLATTQSK